MLGPLRYDPQMGKLGKKSKSNELKKECDHLNMTHKLLSS